MNLNLSLREYVFLALLIATPVTMWFLVFQPQSSVTQTMVSDINEKQGKLTRIADARRLAVSNVEQDIRVLERVITMMNNRIPDAEQTGKMIEEIDAMARANGLKPTQITPVTRTSELTEALSSRFGSQWVIVDLQGDFMGLYQFIQDIENQPRRIMRINKLTVTKLTGREGVEGTIKASFELITFFRLPPEPKDKDKTSAAAKDLSA